MEKPRQNLGNSTNYVAMATRAITTDEQKEADIKSFARCYKAVRGAQDNLIDFGSTTSQRTYMDNCANTHISNCRDDYVTFKEIPDDLNEKVANIGGATKPSGIGTV